MTDVSPMDCDGQCPRPLPRWYCCRGCHKARQAFCETAPAEVKALWTETLGFWDPQAGCRLSREQRPFECRDYHCTDQIYLIASGRWQGKWPQLVREVSRATATEEDFLAKAKDLWQDLHLRTVIEPSPSQSSWDRAVAEADGPTLYLMQGVLGSGKSSWAKKFCARHPRARIVSADSFRKMWYGEYRYEERMDPIIDGCMESAIAGLVRDGYDPVVDVGNLTKARRAPWLQAARTAGAQKVVVIELPVRHREWHLMRRQRQPHRETTDWGKILDGEFAAREPIEASECDLIVPVCVAEVSGRKILILSASPVRDKHIDALLAAKLRSRGHEVEVHPCLRGGRQKVLAFQPEICIVPPIRNPNSRDFVTELKRFGCAVITRHTEPSCSWQDWKKMDQRARMEILGAFEYHVDLELVWSSDEADILNRRPYGAKAVPVGAIGLDIYFDDQLKAQRESRPAFCQKYGFDSAKPTVLISSPWGFADSSPDLQTDDMTATRRDEAGRARHLEMIEVLHGQMKESWNILVTIHPGVQAPPYLELCQSLGIPLEAAAPMLDMLPNCQGLVHAGSTAAVSAHLLGVPAFQYGDVNAEGVTNWWGIGESPISRVSPRCQSATELVAALEQSRQALAAGGSNAHVDVIKELEQGRYGVIDGRAVDRAIQYIENLDGRFQFVWPRSPHDYRQLTIQRQESDFFTKGRCNVCGECFCMLTEPYIEQLATSMAVPVERLRPKMGGACPHCASRLAQI